MPVRSLTSSVLKWPDSETVLSALQDWARRTTAEHPEVVRLGYFGSYARGDWGVGSDLDLVVVLKGTGRVFPSGAAWLDTTSLPVPVDLLAYSEAEFSRVSLKGIVWLVDQ